MWESTIAIYAEKGMEPFKKPLLYAIPFILILYFMVYSPIGSKLENKKSKLLNIESIAEFYEDYSNAKLKILYFQIQFPATKDKDDWLNHVLSSNAKKHGITFDSISAQKEVEISNYWVVSREVSLSSDYDNVGKWICDMENSPIFLKITEFALKKDPTKKGRVRVNLTLSTVFAKATMDNT
ncbi:MAG: type 4a pilus biogenesis protein PilO [Elusimicrobia bacterium]|nr:type 4a pilus biogenesis protein PilO [Elusimicrobiota bacterium]